MVENWKEEDTCLESNNESYTKIQKGHLPFSRFYCFYPDYSRYLLSCHRKSDFHFHAMEKEIGIQSSQGSVIFLVCLLVWNIRKCHLICWLFAYLLGLCSLLGSWAPRAARSLFRIPPGSVPASLSAQAPTQLWRGWWAQWPGGAREVCQDLQAEAH